MTFTHTFAGNSLDRADTMRRDEAQIQAATDHHTSLYLPLRKLNVLVNPAPSKSSATDSALQLCWLSQHQVAAANISVTPVLLGTRQATAHFAIDVSELDDPRTVLGLAEDCHFEDCRSAAMMLSADQSGIVAQSRSQIDWHRRHQFCSVCGKRTSSQKGGHVRRCPSCKSEHFPRTDPVAIMLIVDGDRCLLGQSAGRLARTGMYSALAGFIDQGESIEEAVRREVGEEAGVQVADVRYHSSQPWPFPSSLMIGCHGRATSTEICMDTTEMADVRWFSRVEVDTALRDRNGDLKLPGPIAIAHHLIASWVAGDIEFA